MARKPTPEAKFPKPIFKSLWRYEHTRRLALGLPCFRHSRIVSYGYEPCETYPYLQIPIHDEFIALLGARRYLEQGYSVSMVQQWLVGITKRPITVANLQMLMRDRYPLDEIEQYSIRERERFATYNNYWSKWPEKVGGTSEDTENQLKTKIRRIIQAENWQKESGVKVTGDEHLNDFGEDGPGEEYGDGAKI